MDERLIVAVSCHPILYDKHSADFKNAYKKREIWESIALMCGRPVDKVQAKWKNLVDTYRKILKKEKDPNKDRGEWRHAQRMAFMVPHILSGIGVRAPPSLPRPVAPHRDHHPHHHQGPIITVAPPLATQGATFSTILAPAPSVLDATTSNSMPPTVKDESPDTTHTQPYTPETPENQEAPDLAENSPEFLYEISEEEEEEDEDDDNEDHHPIPAKARRYSSHDPSLTPFQAGLLRAIEETTAATTASVPSPRPTPSDPDEMFFMSLVPTVRSFSPRRKAAVKFKIHQLIYENETEALNEASSTQEQ